MNPPELIAIGTSLGGLNAVSRLLAALPQTFTVPIVIVQHRAITPQASGLAELLQQQTALRVIEAEDKMPIESGTVYLAPADYHLMVEDRGVLALSTEGPVRAARPSIDVLFQSAADAYRHTLVAVLLTGASTDGADGLAAVKAHGGRALVEDPATAECRTMPAAGIATAAVDYVLPLPRIPEHLMTLAEGTRT
jgi:two-component system chemotaxis response regulator CheB